MDVMNGVVTSDVFATFNLQAACAKAWNMLNCIYPRLMKDMRFEHYDESGWWFSYELINDDRRQTYCVRPNEIKRGETK